MRCIILALFVLLLSHSGGGDSLQAEKHSPHNSSIRSSSSAVEASEGGRDKDLVLLLDVYDTTFLVGSSSRCSPSCTPAEGRPCGDLNNDDVTRFGLGERKDFTIVREHCPLPHLLEQTGQGTEASAGGHKGDADLPARGRVLAVISTDFQLKSEITWRGEDALRRSPWTQPSEALHLDKALQVAWLVEPRALSPRVYEQVLREQGRFDLIFTHVREFESLGSKFRYCPFGTTYLRRYEHKLYDKSQLLSMIASRKGFQKDVGGMQGHKFRHDIIRRFEQAIGGLFADGYSTSRQGWKDNKVLGLKDFMFTIVVENVRDDCWFTEKLIDAFLTGTIPIYWGCPTIGRHFNARGIIVFTHLHELEQILPSLSADLYQSLQPFREENFRYAKAFVDPVECMWRNGIGTTVEAVHNGTYRGVRGRDMVESPGGGAMEQRQQQKPQQQSTQQQEQQQHQGNTANERFLIVTVADPRVPSRWYTRTLQSVMGQTYASWRMYVVVDDHVPTEMREEIAEVLRGEGRVEFVFVEGMHTRMYGVDRALERGGGQEIAVLLLFGDWLSGVHVLGNLARMYAAKGCWMSYGSAVEFPNGRLQSAYVTAMSWDEVEDGAYRTHKAWRFGPLYSFRLHLYLRLHKEDITVRAAGWIVEMSTKYDDDARVRATAEHQRLSGSIAGAANTSYRAVDDDFMRAPYDEVGLVWPLAEMSGHRVCFVEDIVYVYNVVTRPDSYRHQGILGHMISSQLYQLMPYQRLKSSRLHHHHLQACTGTCDRSSSRANGTLPPNATPTARSSAPTARLLSPADADEVVVGDRCAEGDVSQVCSISVSYEVRGVWLPEEGTVRIFFNNIFVISNQRNGGHFSFPVQYLASGEYTISIELVSNGRSLGADDVDVSPPEEGEVLASDFVTFLLRRPGEPSEALQRVTSLWSMSGNNFTEVRRAPAELAQGGLH